MKMPRPLPKVKRVFPKRPRRATLSARPGLGVGMAPLFLVVEGLDGSGGTTQAARLATWLRVQGRTVVETCEPSPGPIGRFIRASLGDPAREVSDAALSWLFAADRHDHLAGVVLPALNAGSDVVSDRYLLSSLAYQGASVGLARVAELNADFRAPDLTIFLELDPVVSLARVTSRGAPAERFEALDRLTTVRAAYMSALELVIDRGERVVSIDASGTPDEVSAAIQAAVSALRP